MVPPRQQRLFSGAIFPECVNASLWQFADRHGLSSNIWIPSKSFSSTFKPYGIHILPTAVLCDVSLAPGGDVLDIIRCIGVDRLLVNADHTSNPSFFEQFRHRLCGLPVKRYADHVSLALRGARNGNSELGVAIRSSMSATSTEKVSPLTSSPPVEEMRIDFPLFLNGAPSMDERSHRLIAECVNAGKHYHSPYWIPARHDGRARAHFLNADETMYSGRFNPMWTIQYHPHTYTNQSFPMEIAAMMRYRAARYGYVSRLWVTHHEAINLFGAAGFRPERIHDGPAINTSFFSAGRHLAHFFCADQFLQSASIFPTSQWIAFAARGVIANRSHLRAYPFLNSIAGVSFAGKQEKDGPDRGSMTGADASMTDAHRQLKFAQVANSFSSPRLLGFFTKSQERKMLHHDGLEELLRRQCILRGFQSDLFIHHQTLRKLGLELRSAGEMGTVHCSSIVPLLEETMWCRAQAWMAGLCWYNADQLREPDMASVMYDAPPRHFFSRRYMKGSLCTTCARLQLHMNYQSNEWLTMDDIHLLSWSVRPEAVGVPVGVTASKFRLPIVADAPVLFNLDEVRGIPLGAVRHFQSYNPRDEKGRLFSPESRKCIAMRAFERGYTSHKWCPLVAPHGQNIRACREHSAPIADGRRALPTSCMIFADPPHVLVGGVAYVNHDELARAHDAKQDVVANSTTRVWDSAAGTELLPLDDTMEGSFFGATTPEGRDKLLFEQRCGSWSERVRQSGVHSNTKLVASDDDILDLLFPDSTEAP